MNIHGMLLNVCPPLIEISITVHTAEDSVTLGRGKLQHVDYK